MNLSNESFEQNLARLEKIVFSMEKGDISLDESLKLFQEGTELVRICGKLLDDAELHVTKVLTDAEGRPTEEVFVNDSEI